MTTAACIYCGNVKFGAFNPCDSCGRAPQQREDVIQALALTDHYFSVEELNRIGEQIKNGTPFTVDRELQDEIAVQIDDKTLAILRRLGDPKEREKCRKRERRRLLIIGAILLGWIGWMIYRFATT